MGGGSKAPQRHGAQTVGSGAEARIEGVGLNAGSWWAIPAAQDADLGSRRARLARHEYRSADIEELGQFPRQGCADLSLAGENR